jgi:hypothetical protein
VGIATPVAAAMLLALWTASGSRAIAVMITVL